MRDIIVCVVGGDGETPRLFEAVASTAGRTLPTPISLHVVARAPQEADLRDARVIVLDCQGHSSEAMEILATLKGEAGTRHIPVVVILGPADRFEVKRFYSAGAAGCFVKAQTADGLRVMIEAIVLYWTECRVPGGADGPTPALVGLESVGRR